MKKLLVLIASVLLSSGWLVASEHLKTMPATEYCETATCREGYMPWVFNVIQNNSPGFISAKSKRRSAKQREWFAFTVKTDPEVICAFVKGLRDYEAFDSEKDLQDNLINSENPDDYSQETLLHILAAKGLTEEDDLYKCLTQDLGPSLPKKDVRGEQVIGIDPTLKNYSGKTAKDLISEYALDDTDAEELSAKKMLLVKRYSNE